LGGIFDWFLLLAFLDFRLGELKVGCFCAVRGLKSKALVWVRFANKGFRSRAARFMSEFLLPEDAKVPRPQRSGAKRL
jgi:hypothetical protein